MQNFGNITLTQYNSQATSAFTIQETVAQAIGYGVVYTDVTIVSAVGIQASRRRLAVPYYSAALRRLEKTVPVDSSAVADSAIQISYIVASTAIAFSSSAAAYSAYSNALITSVADGQFKTFLVGNCGVNGATFLAQSTPQSPTAENYLGSAPSLNPTASAPSVPSTTSSMTTLTIATIVGIAIGGAIASCFCAIGFYYLFWADKNPSRLTRTTSSSARAASKFNMELSSARNPMDRNRL